MKETTQEWIAIVIALLIALIYAFVAAGQKDNLKQEVLIAALLNG